jgi:hypothetical protein
VGLFLEEEDLAPRKSALEFFRVFTMSAKVTDLRTEEAGRLPDYRLRRRMRAKLLESV